MACSSATRLACGYSDIEIRRLKRTREWLVVRRGAYVEAAYAPPEGDADAWHRLRTFAVLHHVDEPAVATHSSAGALLRLPQWRTDLSQVYITRSRHHAGRIEAGVVVADAVLRIRAERERGKHTEGFDHPARGATREDLDRLAGSMADWPKARAAVAAFAFADAGAEAVGESLARIFLVSLGFPAPQTQVVVTGPDLVARVDMLIEALNWVIEFDGRMKYRRRRDDCDPVVDEGDIVWAEKIREDKLRALDKPVSRLIWADLFGSQRRRAAASLWRTAERLGAPKDWPRPSWLRAA